MATIVTAFPNQASTIAAIDVGINALTYDPALNLLDSVSSDFGNGFFAVDLQSSTELDVHFTLGALNNGATIQLTGMNLGQTPVTGTVNHLLFDHEGVVFLEAHGAV